VSKNTGYSLTGLAPGNNPQVVPKEEEQGPPEGVIDTTVKVYRLNPDGSKGEFLRTMPAYPEGWEERRSAPGSGGKKKEKEEDDEMAKKRTKAKIDWKEIGPKIDELNAKGVTTRAIADTVGISYASVFRYLEKQKEITPSKKQIKKDIFTGETEDSWKCSACGGTTDYVERFTDAEGEKLCMQCYLGKEQQTQPPESDQAANQEPEREEPRESAENSIPYSVERLENIGREINPDDDTKIYTPERQNYTITQYNEQIKQGGFTAADEEPIPYTPVENPFDLNRFKIAVLEIFQEVARANQAPAYVSLAFMNAIIDTYPEKGE